MNVDNAEGDQWILEINGNVVGIADWSHSDIYDIHEVTATATGTSVLDSKVQGVTPEVNLTVQEPTLANLRIAIGSANSVPLKPGKSLPTVSVNLHNPNASDDTLDRHFFAVAFQGFGQSGDGREQNVFTLRGRAQVDSEGNVFQFGKPGAQVQTLTQPEGGAAES